MPSASAWPEPDAASRAHSDRLCALVASRIADAGGWLDFADYMQLCLYAPGLGYYSAGATKFGAAGDFVTAPELSPLFAGCLARHVVEVLRQCPGGSILEIGPGSGRLATDLLGELAARGESPCYQLLEVSGELRARQRATLARERPDCLAQVEWLDAPPAAGFRGVILANEVVDALPVRRFRATAGDTFALGVTAAAGGFAWDARPADDALRALVAERRAAAAGPWPDGYTSEVCPSLAGWLAAVTGGLEQGAALLLDYGLPRREYYHPDRADGTLRCHYRQRAHADPFLWPGLQDVTAWVDFTALAEAADAAGLEVAGYTTQAQFLLALGLAEDLARVAGTGDARAVVESAAARRLLLPGEMGEAVKVLGLVRGHVDLPGFGGRDLRHLL